MAIQSFQLDPNAQSYTDDEIVGKINTATANITKAGAIEATALSSIDTDDIAEGTGNLYEAGDMTGDEIVAAINSGSDPITRESALSQNDLMIVKTNPVAGEFQVKNIQRDAAGELDIEYDDVAES